VHGGTLLHWLAIPVAAAVLAVGGPPETPPHLTDHSKLGVVSVSECDAWVQAAPRNLSSYGCYLRATLRPEARQEATTRLEALAATRPTEPRVLLYLALARLRAGSTLDKEGLLRNAAQRFQEEGEAVGETYARLNLEYVLRTQGRLAEARAERLRARTLADAQGDPILIAYTEVCEGWEAFSVHDFGGAQGLFERARDVLVLGPNGYLESLAWEGLSSTSISLGRWNAAMDAEERRIRALERDGGPTFIARGTLANRAFYLADTGAFPWSEVDRLIDEARATAQRAGSKENEEAALFLHALRRGGTAEGLAELEETLRFARETKRPYRLCSMAWHVAQARMQLDPPQLDGVEALLDEAVEIARAGTFLDQLGPALVNRALLHWQRGEGEEGWSDADSALGVLELERDRQYEESARIGVVAGLPVYVDVAEALLRRGELSRAFAVSERLRARSLLESLRGEHAVEPLPPVLAERGRTLRARLTELQSKLLDPALEKTRREALQASLAAAEEEERALRSEAARATARPRQDAESQPATLEDIQSTLRPDEALVGFVVAPDGHLDRGDHVIGPRSWAYLVTRNDIRVTRIPERDALAERIGLFRSLVAREDGSEADGAGRLYGDLLAGLLPDLSSGVRRLVLVLDGPLYALPFESLRRTGGGPMLAEQFELVRSPSATLWARWHRAREVGPREPLLALADPGMPGDQLASTRQAAPWLGGLRLGALPHARREVEQAARTMGGGSEALVGAEASEHALKTRRLRRWAVLHLAAHAVMDDEVPERSAVVLAPGAPTEDGLLQMRDVAGLDLEGMVVVLASCRSASGPVQRGEGPVGLARAFLQAGARAVVVSLWELRDEASEKLFGEFYAQLAEGASVEEALHAARAARIRAGAPVADWAGVLLVGDGSLHVPRGTSQSEVRAVAATVAGLLGALVILALVRRRPRRGAP
jgi:hypothetical protein